MTKDPHWIWIGNSLTEGHAWVYARQTFQLEKPPGTVQVEISADIRYFLWINGSRVGFGPPKSHWENATVDFYEIGDLVVPGRNVVAVLIYGLGQDIRLSSCMTVRPGLWFRLTAGEAGLVSDRTWKVAQETAYTTLTPKRGDVQPPVECFDARKSLGAPWRNEFDDSAWDFATEIDEPAFTPIMEPRDIPAMSWTSTTPDRCVALGGVISPPGYSDPLNLAVRAETIAKARRIPAPETARVIRGRRGAEDRCVLSPSPEVQSYAIWDFGNIWTGYPVLRFRGQPGAVIDVSYGEELRNGSVVPTKHGLKYFDRLIADGNDVEHRITWPKCLRYLQVDVCGGRVELLPPQLERSAYPVHWQGQFSCEDRVLEAVCKACLHTVELCMEDSYMDTPWRERGSWLGDDLPKMMANDRVFGDHALARRFLLHHARGQLDSGQFQGKYPGWASSMVSTWTLIFPQSLRAYCNETGDLAFAREMLGHLTRLVGWLDRYLLPEGVYGNLPLEVTPDVCIYNAFDWAPVDTSGASAGWNAFAYEALKASADVAAWAGDSILEKDLRRRADALGHSFQSLFWDNEKGRFVNSYQDGRRSARWGCHENYLAVLYGISSPDQTERIADSLSKEDLTAVFRPHPDDYDSIFPGIDANWSIAIATNRYRWDDERMVPLGTPYFAGYALRYLFESGQAKLALDLIRHRWGDYLRQGGTTVWETWHADTGSLSHGWGCGPAVMFHEYVVGLRYRRFENPSLEIIPQSGGLERCCGRLVTPAGLVQVAWQSSPEWILEIDLPAGASALVALPAKSGETLLRDGVPCDSSILLTRYRQNYLGTVCRGGHHILSATS